MDSIPVALVSHKSNGKVTKTALRSIIRDHTNAVEFRSLSVFHRPGALLRLADCLPAGIDSLEVCDDDGRFIAAIVVQQTGETLQAVVR